MGKPNKQRACRGGAVSKRYRAAKAFVETCRREKERRMETESQTHLLRSTVVTLKTTPLSHRIMKSLWEKGQFPMLSPSLPA